MERGKGYWRYWGKARKEGESGVPCHLLAYHCLDVAAVGSAYLAGHTALRVDWATRLGIPDLIRILDHEQRLAAYSAWPLGRGHLARGFGTGKDRDGERVEVIYDGRHGLRRATCQAAAVDQRLNKD